MEKLVVTEGQDLFPQDMESLTEDLSDLFPQDEESLTEDLSGTNMHTLPQYIFGLVALQKLLLRNCEILMMELPPEIGDLKNLEVLDLEGTEILCLPMEIAKLVNLTCLKVSFYGYANQTVIPKTVLSNLSRLKELIIDVTPYGEWWDVEVKDIIDDLRNLKELTSLKLSLPTAELLEDLTLILPGLANFRFTVGCHEEHFISRLPRNVEEEFNNQEKLEKGLKFINGNCIPNEITKVLKHANAFFLQRHWTAESLSEFGHENLNEVKFFLVMECNEFRTIIDSEKLYQGKDERAESKDFPDFDEAMVLGSLQRLIIRYMKHMESIWKGSVAKGSLSNLKSLALHTCPKLTTLFTIDMLSYLINLEELIVEDCPKINSLVSHQNSGSKSVLFLPSLKKISLLHLPGLVSISSGQEIAPKLERMVVFYCPKLKLSATEVSSKELKVIKGDKEWWDALKWYESDLSTEDEDYLASLFIPLRKDGDLMAQLTEDEIAGYGQGEVGSDCLSNFSEEELLEEISSEELEEIPSEELEETPSNPREIVKSWLSANCLSNFSEEELLEEISLEELEEIPSKELEETPSNPREIEDGPDDVKIKMASLVGRMTLTNSSKEQIARQSSKILVELLSKPEERSSSLQALFNLSSLDDNLTILVDSAVLPALTDILFENQDSPPELKGLAASIIANVVSKPGHWELASADKKGNSIQSETVVSSFLGLLSVASPQCQVAILHVLYGMVSSPQASESVACHIRSGDGIKTIIAFLEHPEVNYRIYAFRLTRVLSERFGDDLANELKASNKLPLLKQKLLDSQSADSERSNSACILGNVPLSEDDVKTVLGLSFLKWTISTLKELGQSSNRRTSMPSLTMVEGLLGLLLHFTRCTDPRIVDLIKEHRLLRIFRDALVLSSYPSVKQLSARGLKCLSESGRILIATGESDPPTPHGFCSPLVFMCGRPSPEHSTCPIHNSPCEDDSQFCLLKGDCIKPLVNLLSFQDTNVQIAALEALSTLLVDSSDTGFKQAVEELYKLGMVDAVILLFSGARPGELQEKASWMVERVLRVESVTQEHSLNQSLVRALVEALKHGNAVTKSHAQEALTNLKQISGVGGKRESSQTRGRR